MNEKQVLKHTGGYDEGLLKALKDSKEARTYLEVALDEPGRDRLYRPFREGMGRIQRMVSPRLLESPGTRHAGICETPT